MMRKLLVLVVVLVSSIVSLNSQTKNELQVGLAVPQGDFADDNEVRAIYGGDGMAATGAYLNYKLIVPLSAENLFWTFNIGAMYNDLQKDLKGDWEDYWDDEGARRYNFPKYLNGSVILGLQYETVLADNLGFFGEAGVGVNILKLTNFSVEANYEDYKWVYSPSTDLAYKIAGGIILNDKYTISLNYLKLGSHKVKYEEIYEYGGGYKEKEKDKFNKALSISSLNITLGVRF